MNLITTFSNPEPYPNTSDSFIISLYLSLSFSLSHMYIHVEFKLNWKTEFRIKFIFMCLYFIWNKKPYIHRKNQVYTDTVNNGIPRGRRLTSDLGTARWCSGDDRGTRGWLPWRGSLK